MSGIQKLFSKKYYVVLLYYFKRCGVETKQSIDDPLASLLRKNDFTFKWSLIIA